MAIVVSCPKCPPITHQAVFNALEHESIHYVDFVFGPLFVNARTLRSIANDLRRGIIGAEADRGRKQLQAGAAAHWDQNQDKFVFGSDHPNRALVVHEAIHALQDRVRFPTVVTQAEATANLGEAILRVAAAAVLRSISPEQAVKDVLPRLGPIDAAATRVAMRKGMVRRSRSPVFPGDLVEIENEIRKNPLYAGIADDNYGFNGIPRR